MARSWLRSGVPTGHAPPSHEDSDITRERRLWGLPESRAQNFPFCQARFALEIGQKLCVFQFGDAAHEGWALPWLQRFQ